MLVPISLYENKGELEDDIIKLGFDHTVILRPGALLGERKESHGLGNSIAQTIGSGQRDLVPRIIETN